MFTTIPLIQVRTTIHSNCNPLFAVGVYFFALEETTPDLFWKTVFLPFLMQIVNNIFFNLKE